MCFGMDKTRHPAQPIAKQNVPDARRVHPKDSPAIIDCLPFILTHRAGNLHIKALSLSKNQISGKKEVNQFSKKFGTEFPTCCFPLILLALPGFVH